jgi:hypothetical protein
MREPADLLHDEVDRFGAAVADPVGVEAGRKIRLMPEYRTYPTWEYDDGAAR